MTSSVISFAYFINFSSLNISRTNAGICKGYTAFSFFHRILCDTPKKSRGKNLIIVALKVVKLKPEKIQALTCTTWTSCTNNYKPYFMTLTSGITWMASPQGQEASIGHARNLLTNQGKFLLYHQFFLPCYIYIIGLSLRRNWTFGNSFSQWRRVSLHGLQVKNWNMPARWMVQCATHRIVCYN